MADTGLRRTPLSPGRPKTLLDERLLVELAAQGWGFKRIAKEYIHRTGQYVSHSTVRDRLIRASSNRVRENNTSERQGTG